MSNLNLTEQYFIRARGEEEFVPVDKETYVRHERNAGFSPSHGRDKNEPCTASFYDSRYTHEGKIIYAPHAA